MKNSTKVLMGVCVGLAAGIMAGRYLASEEGQEMTRQWKDEGEKLLNTAADRLQAGKERANQTMESISDKSSRAANQLTETVQDKLTTLKSTVERKLHKAEDMAKEDVEQVKHKVESGAEKARRIIDEKARDLDLNT